MLAGGVHINVGRTVAFGRAPTDEHLDGEQWVPHEGYWWRSWNEVSIHIALMTGDVARASQLAGEDLRASYDSVQFPLFAPLRGHWMAEAFTEVVMLRMLSEPDFLPDWLRAHQADATATASLRCGPPQALRPCRPDEPALQQMAHVCAAKGGEPAVARVARQSGCAIPDPLGNYALPGHSIA